MKTFFLCYSFGATVYYICMLSGWKSEEKESLISEKPTHRRNADEKDVEREAAKVLEIFMFTSVHLFSVFPKTCMVRIKYSNNRQKIVLILFHEYHRASSKFMSLIINFSRLFMFIVWFNEVNKDCNS